jgi:putative addiction module component (TIGR02574 family)
MIPKADLLKLDVATRLELIEERWDSIASDGVAANQLPLTDGERAMLDERLREHRADPESGQPWAEVVLAVHHQRRDPASRPRR